MSKKDKNENMVKLLDVWCPPAEAGPPIGCVATTFTFSSVFFEEECLSRFLQLDTDPVQDGAMHLIEREEKLSNISCAAVMVDQHHCKGMRSLRWDLLPARIPRGILHAKVSVLHWNRYIRIIISSANLTEDGYRRNQEVFGCIDYHPGSTVTLDCLRKTVDFLKSSADYVQKSKAQSAPYINRWKDFLDNVMNVASRMVDEKQINKTRSPMYDILLSGPGQVPIFESIKKVWLPAVLPSSADITSPFFDPPESENKPATEIWNMLKQRGEVKVNYNVRAEESPDKTEVVIHAPETLIKNVPSKYRDAPVGLRKIDESERQLHAKTIWLENENWISYMIGSSNFTSAGLGFSKNPNLEANLLYTLRKKQGDQRYKLLKKSRITGEDIDLEKNIKWELKKEDDEDSAPDITILNLFFDQAVFRGGEEQSLITFTFTGESPREWNIYIEEEKKEVFFNETKWIAAGRPNKVELLWKRTRPPAGFEVKWKDSDGYAWWPVNVESMASLPPPEELRDLPLDVLIDILSSARPIHKNATLKRWIEGKQKCEGVKDYLDPHKRVDTSKFLLVRTKRISWALEALRVKLEKPVMSKECLQWRLYGPVGVAALQKAIAKEGTSVEERTFLMAELALELARVDPHESIGVEVKKNFIKREILKIAKDIISGIDLTKLNHLPELKEYISAVSDEILK